MDRSLRPRAHGAASRSPRSLARGDAVVAMERQVTCKRKVLSKGAGTKIGQVFYWALPTAADNALLTRPPLPPCDP